MKKTIVALMALASVAAAGSLSYNDLPETLKGDLVYANNFDGSITPIINTVNIPVLAIGETQSTGVAAASSWANISNLNTSFTVSMDLVSFVGGNWSDVVSIHAGSNMSIEKDNIGNMHLYVGDGFAGSTVTNGNIELGSVDSLIGKSLTVVMDADNKEVSAYVNFDKIGSVTLPYAAETAPTTVDGFQFGAGWGGGHGATKVELDNIYVWNKALSAKEVASIPEPATATLSLLALAGLASRRRRH